jgi:hypothetical protein
MYSALAPVAASVFGVLQDASLASALPGGVQDDPPQNPIFPFLWYELHETNARGLGRGEQTDIELRTHVYSLYGGRAEAFEVNRLVKALLVDVSLTVEGYRQCGEVQWNNTVALPDEVLNGIKVHELVSIFVIRVEL